MQNPLDPYLGLHKKANQKTTPAYWKRGVVNVVYSSSATADIQIVGNTTTVVKGIQLGSGINPSLLRPGDRVLLWQFDETNPNDQIAIVAYGRNFKAPSVSNSGFVTVPHGSTAYAVPHKLGSIPTAQGASSYVAEVDSGNVFISTSQNADSTNIYLANDSASVNIEAYWFATLA
jgi:hypothetical protein